MKMPIVHRHFAVKRVPTSGGARFLLGVTSLLWGGVSVADGLLATSIGGKMGHRLGVFLRLCVQPFAGHGATIWQNIDALSGICYDNHKPLEDAQ